jgi:hypothetical protein
MWHGGREEKFTEGFGAKKRRIETAFRLRRRRVILNFILKKLNGRILTDLP